MTTETAQRIETWLATAEGWCTKEKAMAMADLIVQTKPRLVVEIGVFAGGSFVPQAYAMEELKHERPNSWGWIIGIDPWAKQEAIAGENPENQKWWGDVDLDRMHSLAAKGIEGMGTAFLIRASSAMAAISPLFAGIETIDILNIDGNHSERAATLDVRLWIEKVRPGGFVWFDDVDWPSTANAISELERFCTLRTDYKTYRLYERRSRH